MRYALIHTLKRSYGTLCGAALTPRRYPVWGCACRNATLVLCPCTLPHAVATWNSCGSSLIAAQTRTWNLACAPRTITARSLFIALSDQLHFLHACVQYDGKMPLHYAAENGHLEVVRLLLDRDADKDIKSRVRPQLPSALRYYFAVVQPLAALSAVLGHCHPATR